MTYRKGWSCGTSTFFEGTAPNSEVEPEARITGQGGLIDHPGESAEFQNAETAESYSVM